MEACPLLRFHVRVFGHASIYGSDASSASGPSNQISFNPGPSNVGGLGPLLSSSSLAFATLGMISGRQQAYKYSVCIRPDCKLFAVQYCRVVVGFNNTVTITLILHS